MKKLLLLFLIGFSCLHAFSQWNNASEAITGFVEFKQVENLNTQTLVGVVIVDENDDWNDYIIVSSNFGTSWNKYKILNEVDINDIACIENTSTVYAASSSNKLYKSINNGVSWDSIQYVVNGATTRPDIEDMKFVSENVGYAQLMNKAGIYKTINGGIDWTVLFTPDNSVYGFAKTLSDNVIVFQGSNEIYLYNENTQTVTRNDLPTYGSYNDLFFTSETHGFLIGGYNNGDEVYETNNGGLTWTLRNNIMEQDSPFYITAIAFSDANNGIMMRDNLSYYMTNNGGQTWLSVEKPFSYGNLYYLTLDMINPTTAYGIAGSGSSMFVTKTLNINDGVSITDIKKEPINLTASIENCKLTFSSTIDLNSVQLSLYSTDGTLILKDNIDKYSANEKLIEKTLIAIKGIYFLKISSNEISKSIKIIVE